MILAIVSMCHFLIQLPYKLHIAEFIAHLLFCFFSSYPVHKDFAGGRKVTQETLTASFHTEVELQALFSSAFIRTDDEGQGTNN
jgi:hypothetical protein